MTTEIPKGYQSQCAASRKTHIDAWRQSGLSKRKYCEQHSLSLTRFTSWVTQTNKDSDVKFVPVEVEPTKQASKPSQTLLIELANGIKVNFTEVKNVRELLLMLGGL